MVQKRKKKKHVWLSGRLHIEGRLNERPRLQRKHKDENEAKQNKRKTKERCHVICKPNARMYCCLYRHVSYFQLELSFLLSMRCQTLSFISFSCSTDHYYLFSRPLLERDWPPCKVVFFVLTTNTLTVSKNDWETLRRSRCVLIFL